MDYEPVPREEVKSIYNAEQKKVVSKEQKSKKEKKKYLDQVLSKDQVKKYFS